MSRRSAARLPLLRLRDRVQITNGSAHGVGQNLGRDSTPRVEIDLTKVAHNASVVVGMLAARGIAVTGVTKSTLGSAEIADVWLQAGVRALADARLANLENLRRSGTTAPLAMLRPPQLGEVDAVVACADETYVTELVAIRAIASAARAARRPHGVMLMVELGDLREGLLHHEIDDAVREVLEAPGLELKGIGVNLACMSGVAPDDQNMSQLSAIVDSVESNYGIRLTTVSGGNSANLAWVQRGAEVGRINDLRLGEALLLGREPLRREPIPGLHRDAVTLVAEVIESKHKPARATGPTGMTPYGHRRAPSSSDGWIAQSILAVGEQDTDQLGLRAPAGIEILGASADQLVVHAGDVKLSVGDTVRFELDYRAMARAMYAPHVARSYLGGQPERRLPSRILAASVRPLRTESSR